MKRKKTFIIGVIWETQIVVITIEKNWAIINKNLMRTFGNSEIWNKNIKFQLRKMHSKAWSPKCRSIYLSLNVLMILYVFNNSIISTKAVKLDRCDRLFEDWSFVQLKSSTRYHLCIRNIAVRYLPSLALFCCAENVKQVCVLPLRLLHELFRSADKAFMAMYNAPRL